MLSTTQKESMFTSQEDETKGTIEISTEFAADEDNAQQENLLIYLLPNRELS